MRDITFQGGTAYVASAGCKNPIAAMMAQEICKQINAGAAPLAHSQATEVNAQTAGNVQRDEGIGRA